VPVDKSMQTDNKSKYIIYMGFSLSPALKKPTLVEEAVSLSSSAKNS
jgi:hypothetical protein